MNPLRNSVLASAMFALATLGVAGCGSPVVGLECKDGYTRCGSACYDLTRDPGNCGMCGNACGEGFLCSMSMCEWNPYTEDGGLKPDAGDGGSHGDGGSNGDGGIDIDAQMGDGSIRVPDGGYVDDGGTVHLADGAVFDGNVGPVGDGGNHLPDGLPDGSFIEPDGAIILPDGAVYDGGPLEQGDGSVGDGSVMPPPPPPLCTGPGSSPTCVCDLGQTPCNLTCVNTNTDHDNCGSCMHPCASDEYCNAGVCALVCTPPLVLCDGQCVDFTSDDNNCGSCGMACGPAAACIYDSTIMNGSCVGQAVGHVVVIGSDMSVVSRSMRQMVGNAVFLAKRNPVRVLAYDAATAVTSRVGVTAAIQQSSTAIGRAYTLTTADPMTVTQQLGDADVFVIETQQNASDQDLVGLGSNWSAALHTFLFRGGVILLLDGGGNNAGTYQILNAATPVGNMAGDPLFIATGTQVLTPRILSLISAGDAIGAGVSTEFLSVSVTVGFTGVTQSTGMPITEVVGDIMTSTPGPVPSGLPVVLHATTR